MRCWLACLVACILSVPALPAQVPEPPPAGALPAAIQADLELFETGAVLSLAGILGSTATGLVIYWQPDITQDEAMYDLLQAVWLSGLGCTGTGNLLGTIGYASLLEHWNLAVPDRQQDMVPYLLLTTGGTLCQLGCGVVYVLASVFQGGADRQATMDLAVLGDIGGVLLYCGGMAAGLAHGEGLRAPRPAGSPEPAGRSAVPAGAGVRVLPLVAPGRLGICLSLP